MSEREPDERTVSPRALGFGLWVGAISWLMHLLLAYGIAEFGCVSPFHEWTLWGITGVAWLILIASGGSILAAAAAAIVAFRSRQRLRSRAALEHLETEQFVARVGALTSGLFVFVIVVETFLLLFEGLLSRMGNRSWLHPQE